jgi:hypothetical protein
LPRIKHADAEPVRDLPDPRSVVSAHDLHSQAAPPQFPHQRGRIGPQRIGDVETGDEAFAVGEPDAVGLPAGRQRLRFTRAGCKIIRADAAGFAADFTR